MELLDFSEAKVYCKRPVEVHARFAQSSGFLETLEGHVAYGPGDALVTADSGEVWPIDRVTFFRTYEPVTHNGQARPGRYRKKQLDVKCKKIGGAFEVVLDGGRGILRGNAGDWLIRYTDGNYGVVEKNIFRSTYRPVK